MKRVIVLVLLLASCQRRPAKPGPDVGADPPRAWVPADSPAWAPASFVPPWAVSSASGPASMEASFAKGCDLRGGLCARALCGLAAILRLHRMEGGDESDLPPGWAYVPACDPEGKFR